MLATKTSIVKVKLDWWNKMCDFNVIDKVIVNKSLHSMNLKKKKKK